MLYSELIYNDKKMDSDFELSKAEYLASFWNPDAVKKIKEARDSSGVHKFKNDQEFENNVITGEYKNNRLLDAVIKLREIEKENKIKNQEIENPKKKMPADLTSANNIINKFNK